MHITCSSFFMFVHFFLTISSSRTCLKQRIMLVVLLFTMLRFQTCLVSSTSLRPNEAMRSSPY